MRDAKTYRRQDSTRTRAARAETKRRRLVRAMKYGGDAR
jgi:hypothetical protein